MQTTQGQIHQRLKLLPDTILREVLLFIDFLLSRLNLSPAAHPSSAPNFSQSLNQFRTLVEAEGSDIEEIDFFADSRDRTPAPAGPIKLLS